tara:strand:+ start:292 stop:717 length:426 start_codon:yes stop_codon:yes gene_type:complete
MTFEEFRKMINRKWSFFHAFISAKKRESLAGEIRAQLLREARTNATYYPQIRTKELWKSIRTFQQAKGRAFDIGLTAGSEIGSGFQSRPRGAYYAIFVEKGTSRMAPRFYLERAFDKVDQTVPNRIKRYMRAYLEDPKYYG